MANKFFCIHNMILSYKNTWFSQDTVIQHMPNLLWKLTSRLHHGAEFWQVSTSSPDIAGRNNYLKGDLTLILLVLLLGNSVPSGALFIESCGQGSNKTLHCQLHYLYY